MESTQKQLSNPENQEAQQPNQLEIIKDVSTSLCVMIMRVEYLGVALA